MTHPRLRGSRVAISATLLFVSNIAFAQRPPSAAEMDSLHQTVAALDSVFFDAYNRCDLDRIAAMASDDLEFYHDQTGLAVGKQPLLDGVRNNICGKVRRRLVRGSLEVYPLKGYGAVENGEHLFCDTRVYKVCPDTQSGIAKFTMLWRKTDTGWILTRVISYAHVGSTSRPTRRR